MDQPKNYKSFKHVSLSGLRGFLKQFDEEQAALLGHTALADLKQIHRKFEAALLVKDQTALLQSFEEIAIKASSFQIDFLANAARALKEKATAGSLDTLQLSDFVNHFASVIKALEKLVLKLDEASELKKQKVES